MFGMSALGAYFGTSRIQEGAAGLGADVRRLRGARAPARAWQYYRPHQSTRGLGVDYRRVMPRAKPRWQTYSSTSGMGGAPLLAYRDGSLGDDASTPEPIQAFADGVIGGSPMDPEMPGALLAYRDGSLGEDVSTDPMEADLASFHDGILGGPTDPRPYPGELLAYHDGSLGSYLGAIDAAANNVLDMGNPGVLKEVKAMMSLIAPEVTLTQAGQQLYPAEFYTSEIWEPEASLLWEHVRQKAPSGSSFSTEGGSQVFPNAAGIGWMAATIGAPQSQAFGPQYLATNFPAVSTWFSAGGGTVKPPFLSLSDKVKGKQGGGGMLQMSTAAWAGVGAVALFGLVLFAKKKK